MVMVKVPTATAAWFCGVADCTALLLMSVPLNGKAKFSKARSQMLLYVKEWVISKVSCLIFNMAHVKKSLVGLSTILASSLSIFLALGVESVFAIWACLLFSAISDTIIIMVVKSCTGFSSFLLPTKPTKFICFEAPGTSRHCADSLFRYNSYNFALWANTFSHVRSVS